jgi:FecR protein
MKRRQFITFMAGATAWLLPVTRSARAQKDPAQPNPAQPNPAQPNQAAANQIGQVATLEGSATATRANAAAAIALQLNDPIFKNDTLATGANSTLGITFDDQTTFSLSANTRIVINEFVYQKGGTANAAAFNVAVGTAAFVASLVARSGDMKIATPVATMGIRGTTGIVEVPESGAAGAGEARVKLYPDSGGHVGRIEVFDAQGGQLGVLTQGASAFALRTGAGGRLAAVPLQISREEAARDRGVLRQLRASHKIGRRMTSERLRSRGHDRQPSKPRQERPSNRNPRSTTPRRSKPGQRHGQ